MALACFLIRLHDPSRLYWSLANLPMLPNLELDSMNSQTIVAILVVALCAVIVLRSWFAFWAGLIRKPSDNQSPQSSCHGCANGCQKVSDRTQLVELKREGPT